MRILSFFALASMSSALVGAGLAGAPGTGRASVAAQPMAPSNYLAGSTKEVCPLTGHGETQTAVRFGLEAADHGYSFRYQGKLWFLFGDAQPPLSQIRRSVHTRATSCCKCSRRNEPARPQLPPDQQLSSDVSTPPSSCAPCCDRPSLGHVVRHAGVRHRGHRAVPKRMESETVEIPARFPAGRRTRSPKRMESETVEIPARFPAGRRTRSPKRRRSVPPRRPTKISASGSTC